LSELGLVARFKIHDGEHERFRDLAKKCLVTTREKDTGTLQYDWYFSTDGNRCVVQELYRDSAAIMEHATNLAALIAEMGTIADPEFEIYGVPSEELVGMLAALPLTVFAPFQSL